MGGSIPRVKSEEKGLMSSWMRAGLSVVVVVFVVVVPLVVEAGE